MREREIKDRESWRTMVLRSMQTPHWLSSDGPEIDVVISSRVRFARNIQGHRFPNHCSADESWIIARKIEEASRPLKLDRFQKMSLAEKEYMLGARLASPEFLELAEGRVLLLNQTRSLSIMVNEEDHLRLQVLTPGWSIESGYDEAREVMAVLQKSLTWSKAAPWGYLTASPYNIGPAARLSAMFHLIALAHLKRMGPVIQALTSTGLVVRGLFGESSRAVGAFFQVSATRGEMAPYVGSAAYLLRLEREARAEIGRTELQRLVTEAVAFAVEQKELPLHDALRVLAWVRFAAASSLPFAPTSVREVDDLLTTLEVQAPADPKQASQTRAHTLRPFLERMLPFRNL